MRATIALTRYNEPNWLLWQVLDGLSAQKGIEGEVLVLDQTCDRATADKVASLGSPGLTFQCVRIPARSLSYARNRAIAMARHPIILFLDSDAVAEPGWARELAGTLSQACVGVAGGRILPIWHKRPLLIAEAQLVREQYSMLDLGVDETVVTKVVGAGFGIHRERLGDHGYFDESLGRRAGTLLGGEETDLCARAISAGLDVRYNGRAVVQHHVLPDRVRYRWILNRLFYAGVSRAMRGGVPSPTHGLRFWDLVFMPLVVPVYAFGFIAGVMRAAAVGRSPRE